MFLDLSLFAVYALAILLAIFIRFRSVDSLCASCHCVHRVIEVDQRYPARPGKA